MQRAFIIFFLLIVVSAKSFSQRTEDILVYITTYKQLAINEMKRTGVPAAITLAQGIHETEAGKSDLVRKSNNHFGIKCKSTWTGDKVFHDDDARGECFRSYTRPEESYMDHSDFLKNSQRYSFLFDLDPTDFEAWAYGLRKAGYATNIRYSQILIKLIRDYNLQDYTLIAMGKKTDPAEILVANTPDLPSESAPGEMVVKKDVKKEAVIKPFYPTGEFRINNTKVIYVNASTAWLSLAEQYDIPLNRLWDFNDLEKDDDLLLKAQLVYLQRKRKTGANEYHIMQEGESLYDVCQAEGLRLESLLDYNHLNADMLPAPGEKLYLQAPAQTRPLLSGESKPGTGPGTPSLAAAPVQVQKDPASSPVDNSAFKNAATSFTTHLVATKETLYSISRKYGVEMEKIKEWNSLNSLDLRIGQSLIIYKN